MKIITKILTAVTLCLPAMAYCATYRLIPVCWGPPTAREDGTPLPISEIRGYQIFYKLGHASCGTVDNKWKEVKPPRKMRDL